MSKIIDHISSSKHNYMVIRKGSICIKTKKSG
jgi:hypothetical protein